MSTGDEVVRFEQDIRPLFRPVDHESMAWAFDLSSYDDVKDHAGAISSACARVRCRVTGSGPRSTWIGSSGGLRREWSSSEHSAVFALSLGVGSLWRLWMRSAPRTGILCPWT